MTQKQMITARDGTRLAYRLTGTGPTRIALVHSLAMDADFWAPVAERLSGEATVLTWDCRGHGASDKPAGPYTVEQFADDLADLLGALDWPDAVVAGASMGGCVAQAFAGRHPQRTTGLGLFDTTAWYGPTAPDDWEGRAAKAREAGMAALTNFQVQRWFGDAWRAANPETVQHCIDIFVANDVDAYSETCRMLGRADLRDLQITAPTRILVGEEDYATPPEMARALQAAIPGASCEIIAGGRHLTPLEFPDRIAAALLDLTKETAQ